jgi:transposase, IS5 family
MARNTDSQWAVVVAAVRPTGSADRNYLKGSEGDAINAVLAAAGYNFRRLLALLRLLLRAWLVSIMRPHANRRSFSVA